MALQLNWEIEGVRQISRKLQTIEDQVKDWRPAFRRATSELKSIFSNDVFRTEGRAIRERWKPLKPQYLAQKRQRGFSGGTLVGTGRMKNSFQTIVKPDMGVVWNSIFYFRYHQSKAPRRKLPRRVMMKLANQQRELVVKIFHETFFRKVSKA